MAQVAVPYEITSYCHAQLPPEAGMYEVLLLSCCQTKGTQRGIHEYICLPSKWSSHELILF